MGEIPDEQVGQRWGKVEPALWGRRRYSFTHRTKVFAGGTIRKIHVRPQETCRCPGSNQVSDPISESEMGSDAPSGVGERNSTTSARRITRVTGDGGSRVVRGRTFVNGSNLERLRYTLFTSQPENPLD